MAQLFVSSIGACRKREISPSRTIISPIVSPANLAHHVPTVSFSFSFSSLELACSTSVVMCHPCPRSVLMTQVPVENNVRRGDVAPGAMKTYHNLGSTHYRRRHGRSDRSIPPVQAARVPLLNHPRRATCRRRVVGAPPRGG